MITFTDGAQTRITEMLKAEGHEGRAVRLRIKGRDNTAFVYDIRSVEDANKGAGDEVIETESFSVFIDPASAKLLAGATIDLSIEQMGRFVVDNPNPVWQDETAAAVASLIVDRVNPAVAIHGGRVSLVDFEDDIAYLAMQGGCQGCGLATVTLRQGIEKLILEEVPAVKSIVDTTEHSEGDAPFFQRGQTGDSPLTS
ncbi:MAG: iron-sulfur cluster assembly accessory protein [Chloroflexi bacterium]|nr:iron-sulfur cluster assembly accessory protein [Chloroflexota bacterium]